MGVGGASVTSTFAIVRPAAVENLKLITPPPLEKLTADRCKSN